MSMQGGTAVYQEDELLPISALQHLIFCERQCALIHVEGLWDENRLTVEGQHLHERVHRREDESRGDVRIARGVALRSLRLGLAGIADVVEFHRKGSVGDRDAWVPYPVEYKRGRPKRDRSDDVQLCAQALCLEEMRGVEVPAGALFYGKVRRRREVSFDQAMRGLTQETALRLQALVGGGRTPSAAYEKKCDRCSLREVCLPKSTGGRRSAKRFVANALRHACGAEGME